MTSIDGTRKGEKQKREENRENVAQQYFRYAVRPNIQYRIEQAFRVTLKNVSQVVRITIRKRSMSRNTESPPSLVKFELTTVDIIIQKLIHMERVNWRT